MEIRIITVGKIKEKYLSDGIAEYAKRLSRYCKLTFCQVADEKTPDKASEALNIQIKDTEGERLMKHIREQDYVIALAIDGKMLDSVELSEKIEKLGVSGISSIAFVICMVLSTLRIRSLISFMEPAIGGTSFAVYFSLRNWAVKSASTCLSCSSVSGFKSPVARMVSITPAAVTFSSRYSYRRRSYSAISATATSFR